MSTIHVIDRLASRLSDSDRQAAIERMNYLEDMILSSGSAACVLGRNTARYASGGSEGRVIVAIWRGRWVTAMLRRDNQPMTPSVFGVERVIS